MRSETRVRRSTPVHAGVERFERVTGGTLLAAAVVLAALNLRPAITSVGPVLDKARDAMGASTTWAGLLTTLPGLCFAVAGLAAPWLSRRVGIGPAVGTALGVLGVGLVVRVLDGPDLMLGGTLVACAGIALANVLLPVVVKDSFPLRVGLMTGIYTAALQGGGALGSGLSPLLDSALGGWRWSLGGWAVLALFALGLWTVAFRRHPHRSSGVRPAGRSQLRPSLLRSGLAWTVTLFFGGQAFLAYIVLGWLPLVLMDAGVGRATAAVLVGVVSLIAVPISLVVPPMAARHGSQSGWIVLLGVIGLVGVVGLIIAPQAAPVLWALFVGIGMSVFSLVLTVIALRARTGEDTARLSGMAQGIGYLMAAVGPFLFGLLHDLTGGWTVPFIMVTAVYLMQIVAGAFAGRPRYV
ncbi:MAG: MFS transporter [Pseudonocardia sp.]|nr:MFS transporter [Pseudonocardia sp.]